MTGTVHEIRPRTVEQKQQAIAPILPVVPHVIDIAVQLERIRHAAEQAQAVLRSCPAATAATAQFLTQICDGWVQADAANTALADILECEGQA